MVTEEAKWFRKSGMKIEVFYKDEGTGIVLYEIDMAPIPGKSPYGPLRTMAINFVRKNSGLGARLNQDALEGYRGSAAMIDYVLRFTNHLNGAIDKKIMFGSPNAVRSRVKIIEDELFKIACDSLTEKGVFHFFEVGPGYLRTQINLVRRLREEKFDLKGLKIEGVDLNPNVVKAAEKIIKFESLENVVTIRHGDAKEYLRNAEMTFDAILAEGVFEYCDMKGSLQLAEIVESRIRPGGYLIATATHNVPKRRLIEYLDILVTPRSKEDFIAIFSKCGFDEPKLLATTPPNISVGIGIKKGRRLNRDST
jgi:hypothetical protein